MDASLRGSLGRYRPGSLTTPGRFILSLDCEGKWGLADLLGPYHHKHFTDSALLRAYSQLLLLFARYDISATFAFVMAFTLRRQERTAFADILEPRDDGSDPWLAHYWRALRQGQVEGWFLPDAFEAVRSDGRHEIACHGFCHRLLNEASISPKRAEAELNAVRAAAKLKGIEPVTFVYPRNEVGHRDALARAGFIGYRERLSRPKGQLGRVVSFAEEFNIRPALQHATGPNNGLVTIPPGYFLNWRFGPRRYVPPKVTMKRWRSLLDRSAAKGAVAHLWLHPHNLVTAPATAELLEGVLAHATALRDQGRLVVETQQAYSRRQLQRSGAIIGSSPAEAPSLA